MADVGLDADLDLSEEILLTPEDKMNLDYIDELVSRFWNQKMFTENSRFYRDKNCKISAGLVQNPWTSRLQISSDLPNSLADSQVLR